MKRFFGLLLCLLLSLTVFVSCCCVPMELFTEPEEIIPPIDNTVDTEDFEETKPNREETDATDEILPEDTDDENNSTGTESDTDGTVEPSDPNGTLNAPLTTTQAYNACASLAVGESSSKPFYVKGTVTKIGETGNYYKNVYFTDGTTEMLIYTINMSDGITGFKVGDTITAFGHIKNYNGTIEMATYNGSVFVYVVNVEQESGNQGSTSNHTYNAFTSSEKSTINNTVGLLIPFIPNDDYYVEAYSEDTETGINFYTFGNTQAEFDAYRALFSDYTYEGTQNDDYGDAWYFYSNGDVYVDMAFYYYEEQYVVDVYVYILSDDSDNSGESGTENGGNTTQGYTDFTNAEKTTFNNVVGLVIPFLPNNEYYVEEYTYDAEIGVNFYTYGNTQAEFDAYRDLFSDYAYDGTQNDDYGDAWYFYSKGDVSVDMRYFADDNGEYVVDVYVYVLSEDSGSTGGSVEKPTNPEVDLITNDGKGLPSDADGIYDVDFTTGKYVQNVTDQGYYIDGCPTTGSPAVLVIPVEFSDVTAQSKGYTIENIEKIFNGTGNDTSYYSVHDYFLISSYNKLDLDITVVDSWFRPSNNSSYYANATQNYEGTEEFIGDQLILDEALAYLATVMDLSEFDSDKNGIIDAVVIVNTLEIDSEVDFQWAYRYWNYYTDDLGNYYEYDNVSANDYVWIPYEFMYENYDENGDLYFDASNSLNPYTFIHEFSHAIGADDYYDTTYSENPLGGYDVMDSMAGDHNPYSKFNYGWITSSKLIVTNSSVTVTLGAFGNTGETVILANNWDEDLGAYQEYYVIMYYTATGLNAGEGGYFDRNGIVVYHVNSSLYSQEYEGEIYYDVYNTNTSASDDQYGTVDNLIEIVTTGEGYYNFVEGDSLPKLTDDLGNILGYTFTVDDLTDTTATLTFTKK